jgi:uncharacterized membrane protein YgcG
MKFLRTLQADLRERQIFPAVVLLAVLAIAIPIGASIELSKVSTPPPVSIVLPRLTVPKGVAPPAQELAVLTAKPISSTTRRGSEPNPFREAGGSSGGSGAAAPTSSAPATTKSTSTTTPAKTTPAKTAPAKTAPATTTPAKTTPTTPKSKPKATKPKSGGSGAKPAPPTPATPTSGPATLKATQAYTVNIDTKDATGTHVLSDVVRLAPLPAAQSPEVIYLGVLQGGKKAAFLFTNSVKVSGQSGSALTCLPSADDCQIVELSPGQGMKLAPTSNTALISTFTFELMSIAAKSFPSAGAAKQARDAVSTAGQTLIPLSNSTELATLRFDDKIGALVHQAPPAGSTGASGSTGSTGASGSTGATGATLANAESLPRGIAFVLSPVR